jgi:hypothetical protein
MFVLLDFVHCKLIHIRYLATVQSKACIYRNDIKCLIDLRWIFDNAIKTMICIPFPLLPCSPIPHGKNFICLRDYASVGSSETISDSPSGANERFIISLIGGPLMLQDVHYRPLILTIYESEYVVHLLGVSPNPVCLLGCR